MITNDRQNQLQTITSPTKPFLTIFNTGSSVVHCVTNTVCAKKVNFGTKIPVGRNPGNLGIQKFRDFTLFPGIK